MIEAKFKKDISLHINYDDQFNGRIHQLVKRVDYAL